MLRRQAVEVNVFMLAPLDVTLLDISPLDVSHQTEVFRCRGLGAFVHFLYVLLHFSLRRQP